MWVEKLIWVPHAFLLKTQSLCLLMVRINREKNVDDKVTRNQTVEFNEVTKYMHTNWFS